MVRSGARIIAEHVGWPLLKEGIHQPGFQALLEFGRNTNAIIKLSGGFRISWTGQPYDDIKPYALELLEAFGAERCIWGADWPFLNPDYGPAKRPATVPPVNYKREYATLSNWVSDESMRRSILWTNPARLFGFSETATLNDV